MSTGAESRSLALNPAGRPAFDAQQLADAIQPEDFENAAEYEEYLADLLELFPLDLNRASEDELMLIPGMTLPAARAIVTYRQTEKFRSERDLHNIPEIDPAHIPGIKAWVWAALPAHRTRTFGEQVATDHSVRLQYSMPVSTGYRSDPETSSAYAGSALYIYHRQTIQSRFLSGHLTQVKLPGEDYRFPGDFDFTSAHLAFKGQGVLKTLLVGDYSLRYGQGLVIWTTPSFGKGGTAHRAAYRREQGITPHRSSAQNGFLRGIATEWVWPAPFPPSNPSSEFQLAFWYSERRRSSVVMDGDTIRPPSGTPFHRTENEILRRHNTRQHIAGGRAGWSGSSAGLGITGYLHTLNRPVVPHSYQHPLRSASTGNIGSNGWLGWSSGKWFGEYAQLVLPSPISGKPGNKKSAWITGISGESGGAIRWIIAFRNYSRGYWSEFGNGFGEGASPPSGQKGWYAGMSARLFTGWSAEAFVDRFEVHASRSTVPSPGKGYESMLRLVNRRSSGMNWIIQIRYKEFPVMHSSPDAHGRLLTQIRNISRLAFRMRHEWAISERLNLTSQLHLLGSKRPASPTSTLSRAGQARSTSLSNHSVGTAFTHTLLWNSGNRLQTDLNWTFFQTEDFHSRIVLHEPFLSRSSSMFTAYGLGHRSGIVLRLRLNRWMQKEVSWQQVRYFDRPATGSGNEQTLGNRKMRVAAQLRLSY